MIGELFDPRKTFGKTMTELAELDERIVVFSADSGYSSGFKDFSERHPERYFECGIEEQGCVGMAAGMATVGYIPIFCAIAPFVTARPYEMVRNDVGYMEQNVKLVGRNCGITYSDLGFTHQSLDDFGLMRLIPNMTILAPQDPSEIISASKAMIEHSGPVYMRIGNPKIPQIFEDRPFVIGRGALLKEGNDVTIISTGTTTGNVLKATDLLKTSGIEADLIGLPTVWPLDEEMICASAEKTGRVIVFEEHFRNGGLGSFVSELLSEMKNVVVRRAGLPNVFAATCGSYDRLLEYYRLDPEGVKKTVEEFIRS